MITHPTRLLFYFTLISGTMITISSSSWLGGWMGLEINLLSFIPLMTNKNNQFSSEAALKYFLVQALASIILLFGVVWVSLDYQIFWNLNGNSFDKNMIISSALLLKMGAAPFHFWFPEVMEGLSWVNTLILMTWQKIAPLILISNIITISTFSFTIIILCMVAGSIGGLNQTSLRKVMAYSSINHLGWMLAALLIGDNYWFTYFLFYGFMSMAVVVLFNAHQLSHIMQIFGCPFPNKSLKLALFCNLLSLGGLPPFLGFLPKWVIIQGMVSIFSLPLITLMVILTLITLYFYIRVGYAGYMLTHAVMKWSHPPQFNPSNQTLVNTCFVISLLGLGICSAVISVL